MSALTFRDQKSLDSIKSKMNTGSYPESWMMNTASFDSVDPIVTYDSEQPKAVYLSASGLIK